MGFRFYRGFSLLWSPMVLRNSINSRAASSTTISRFPHRISLLRRCVRDAVERHIRIRGHAVRRLHHHVDAAAASAAAAARRRPRGIGAVVAGGRVLASCVGRGRRSRSHPRRSCSGRVGVHWLLVLVLRVLWVGMRVLVCMVGLHVVLVRVLHVDREGVLLGKRKVAVLYRRVLAHTGLHQRFRGE